MIKIKNFLTIAIFMIAFSNAHAADITLNCNFTYDSGKWVTELNGIYACLVLNDFGTEAQNIIAANGTHEIKPTIKTIFDIQMVTIIDREIFYIPSGLAGADPAVFKSQLEFFYIDQSSIASITEENLTPFGTTLKYFGVTNSKIQFLFKNVFTANTGIVLIDLQGNPISLIESDTFKSVPQPSYLVSLTELRLSGICGATANAITPAAIVTLNDNINSRCGDGTKNQFIDNVVNTFNKCSFERQILDEKVADLDSEIDSLNPTNDPCRFKDNAAEGYSCVGNKINITSTVNQIIAWKGNHTQNRVNADVRGLIIQSQTVILMPREVGKIFANLSTLIIEDCALSALKFGDFNLLENLKKISLPDNKIASIESGTFLELSLLVELNLNNNLLTQLRPQFLPTTINAGFVFSAANNRLNAVDIVFAWKLKDAKLIDLSGNSRCNFKFDLNAGNAFISFYTSILGNC